MPEHTLVLAKELLQTYINFWTLISMNPDSRVRDNVFWFIRKWDIKISKSGFLIAYRNADFKQGSSAYTKEWIERVTNDYIKIKAQKKSPNNYTYKGDKLYKLAEGERDTGCGGNPRAEPRADVGDSQRTDLPRLCFGADHHPA